MKSEQIADQYSWCISCSASGIARYADGVVVAARALPATLMSLSLREYAQRSWSARQGLPARDGGVEVMRWQPLVSCADNGCRVLDCHA